MDEIKHKMEQNYEVGGEVTVRGKITALGGGPFVNDSIQITFGGDILDSVRIYKRDILSYKPFEFPSDLKHFDGSTWPDCNPEDVIEVYYKDGRKVRIAAWMILRLATALQTKDKLLGYRLVDLTEDRNHSAYIRELAELHGVKQ